MKPLVIGIAGGSGSGKTTLARYLMQLWQGQVCVISYDNYYKDFSHLSAEERAHLNFDHPDALDTALFLTHLDALRAGVPVECPIYDFTVHNRKKSGKTKLPAPIVLVEGILLFTEASIRDRLDFKIFVNAPEDVRFARRRQRDIEERGRTAAYMENQWKTTVAPMHQRFVEPTKVFADLMIDGTSPVKTAAAQITALINL